MACFTFRWDLCDFVWPSSEGYKSSEFFVNPSTLSGWDASICDVKWIIVLKPSEIRENHVFCSLRTVGDIIFEFEINVLLSVFDPNQYRHLKSSKVLKFPLEVGFEQLLLNLDNFLRDCNGQTRRRFWIECRMWPRKSLVTATAEVQRVEKNLTNTDNVSKELALLYQEGILCDTKLCTATETFPAHKVVLSARSLVFRAMFTTDMREKVTDSVDIEDLDAETVRQMLLFLYTDKVTGLQWDSAKSLYFAADKYQILLLKHLCTSFLEMNLQVSNCCDILVFADKHQDKGLKKFVQDYILEHNEEVFGSEEWQSFMLKNLQVAAETMYLKVKDK